MSRKLWYLVTLAFPFIFPALLLERNMLMPEGMLGILKVVLILQLVYGGVQYLFFACGILWWSRNKTATDIYNTAWIFPLLFVPVCEAGLIILYLFANQTEGTSPSIGAYILFGLVSPLYGYFYIGLAQLLTWLLEKTDFIRD